FPQFPALPEFCVSQDSLSFPQFYDCFPKDNKGNVLSSKVTFLDAWKTTEELVDEELMKATGISNFNHFQIERLLTKPRLKCKLVANQIECHPCLTQEKQIQCCHSRASLTFPYWKIPRLRRLLQSKKFIAQVLIQFHIQRNVVIIPKSVTLTCIIEKFQAFDFKLNDEETVTILSFNRNWRTCAVDHMSHLEDYPFNAEY
uniref:NADP-dependent oxidoreductase domain-containing protein n=1 Tax=Equus asinus asinus TaxID=83772 RepID=A0A8C4MK40_EQUAS